MHDEQTILENAICVFGTDAQVDKCKEELTECLLALIHYPSGKSTLDDILSELADVQITVAQLVKIYDHDDEFAKVKLQKLAKLDRAIKRRVHDDSRR